MAPGIQPVALNMRYFNLGWEMKKILTRIISIAGVLLFFVLGCAGLNFLLADDARTVSRLTLHELYNQDDIDVLVVGASRTQRGIDAPLVSELTGKKVFNTATVAQYPDASLTLIKEAVKKYDIKEIYFEISEGVIRKYGAPPQYRGLKRTNLVSDFLPFSINKVRFLLKASAPDLWIQSFWPARRNWTKITDINYIKDVLQAKVSKDYSDYKYSLVSSSGVEYKGKGFLAFKSTVKKGGYFKNFFGKNKHLKIENIPSYWEDRVSDVIDFCSSHNIKLTFYAMPASNYYLTLLQDELDAFLIYFNNFIRDRNVEFLDFNTLSEEALPYFPTNYYDEDHLSVNGAEAFSTFFARYMNGEITDDVFHPTIKEKLEKTKPGYYGVNYSENKKKSVKSLNLISNVPGAFEYKVELAAEAGEITLIQDYDVNDSIKIPLDIWEKNNRVIVTYRETMSDKEGTRIVNNY